MGLQPSEKVELLPTTATYRGRITPWATRLLTFASLVVLWATLRTYPRSFAGWFDKNQPYVIDALCPQVDQLKPVKHADLYEQFGSFIDTDSYKRRAIDWLAGAVKVPTESYDEMGEIGEDPRWEAFAPFHTYLYEAFPLIHASLNLTKVNTYGLVYHWQGSNAELKPLLFAAHQDVVPVDPKTIDQWVHPPYSGHFDGTYVWGRGSSDDKSGLISIMSTVETLLEKGFTPTRSVVLAFGFDEETSGLFGAHKIGNYLLEHYGENAFALLIDEGGGWEDNYGQIVATPAVAEKGYLDVRVQINTPGGHSSVPPLHTSIGMISSLLVALESDPPVAHIGRNQPTYSTLQCIAAHAPNVPAGLRKDIIQSISSDQALRRVEDIVFSQQPVIKATVGTTQAIDLISGGVKTNALPEQVAAVVNHRIAADSSVDAVKERVTTLLTPLASKFNLSLMAFGNEVFSDQETRYGTLTLTDAWGTALEPAPITPTDPEDAAYKLLSGSIKSSLLDSEIFRNTNTTVIVAPGIMTGSAYFFWLDTFLRLLNRETPTVDTDTRYYWKLTRHIFRYGHHGAMDVYGGIHTVNEAMKIDGILRSIRFYTVLILNGDEFSL